VFSSLRRKKLKEWVENTLELQDPVYCYASSDASFRSYLRVEADSQSWIIMDSPPEKEKNQEFVHISHALFLAGLNVPEVFHWEEQLGFMILSDLGNTTFLDVLSEDNMAALYGDAMGALRQIQTHTSTDNLPTYDQHMLLTEMLLFKDWLVIQHLNIKTDNHFNTLFSECCQKLAEAALEQPQCFVHRDFHSRNLMRTQKKNPGILDFQDAVCGPITYDLVSLLKDCYISWPRTQLIKMVNNYREGLEYCGINTGSEEAFLRWFDLMGIQRHLKASGIFCRLKYRDNKDNYIQDIPRTLAYIESTGLLYEETRELTQWIIEHVAPRFRNALM